jgi:hypothetical protein
MRIHQLYARIGTIWRPRRFEMFRSTIRPQPTERVLDVGGHPDTWTSTPQDVEQIDCLNLEVLSWNEREFPNHRISLVLGDGCDLSRYADGAYPIAFSNSVIEHVGDRAHQRAFANEMRRVGKRLWIQTPAFGCPFEPHYLAPFMHWYPKQVQRRLARHFTIWGLVEKPTRSQIESMVADTRLLKRREMKALFPDCEIVTERMFLVIPKSYIAIRDSA